MKLKACYWIPALALLAAAPAWANYSWGQMGQFRPGIQFGIVVLVLLTEVLVIRPMTRMSWSVTIAAVVSANAISGFAGYFLLGFVPLTDLMPLLALAIPSTIIEFLIVGAVARQWSARKAQRGEWAFIGVLVANVLSALVTFGYLYANYGGREQPILWRSGTCMMLTAKDLRQGTPRYDQDLVGWSRTNGIGAMFLRSVVKTGTPESLDVAPPWLPWAVMRPAPLYQSALQQRLDPPGQGRPMVWTGAPYFAGRRGVIFTDGRYELMPESSFRQLNARPAPPQITIPPLRTNP